MQQPDRTTGDFARSSRRHFLANAVLSGGPLALALLSSQQSEAKPVEPDLGLRSFDLTPKLPHTPPRATAMISMFMQGGPSQVDLMDPKPLLNKMHLQKFPGDIKYDKRGRSKLANPGHSVEIQEVRPERHRSVGVAAGFVGDCRRRSCHPVDAHGSQQSRPIDSRDEQRPNATGAGRHSAVG